MNYVMVLELKK